VCAVTLAGAAQSGLKSGLDPAQFDKTVRPQDDLFRYVNGTWLKTKEIPADQATYGTFVELRDRAESDLHALVDGLTTAQKTPGSNAQKISDLYASFMDEAAADKAGATPIAARLAQIDGVKTTAELAAVIGQLSVVGLPGPFGAGIEPDKGDPTKNALYTDQGGLALPDRDYYLQDNPRFVAVRAKYRDYLEQIFTLLKRPHAADDAAAVLALETALAKDQWTQVEARDAVKTYNRYTVAKLAQEMPGFDWAAWGKPQGFDKASDWIVEEPSFFKAFAARVPETPLATWKAWLVAQLITTDGAFLSKPFVDARFDMFFRTLNGQEVNRDRWKRGMTVLNLYMGEPLGQLYVEKYFPPAAMSQMQSLVTNLLEAYRQSITGLDWMTPATRTEALTKLSKITTKIGYPKKWRDYSKLEIKRGDLFGNIERAAAFESDYQVSKLTKPVNHDDWDMTPQTVNAYYSPVHNEIVFPAAILQPPFFDPTADPAANYGAIGAIIGHETGHAFDDQGSRYDGDGKLRNWWQPADEAEFHKRTKALVDQYSAYSPGAGLKVNGELTLGENIGDLGGLSIAYKAWKLSLKGQPSPVIDGFTGDQRFFLSWGQAWQGKARPEYLQRQVLADPHSWNEFRANGVVANVPAFYDAFGVKPGDKLYKDPADRVKIW
jgi:putative endopeptidase